METVTKIKLTKAQQEVYDQIKSYPGGHLRMHRRGGSLLVYRLMDKDLNPVKNLSAPMVRKLIERNWIEKQGDVYVAI